MARSHPAIGVLVRGKALVGAMSVFVLPLFVMLVLPGLVSAKDICDDKDAVPQVAVGGARCVVVASVGRKSCDLGEVRSVLQHWLNPREIQVCTAGVDGAMAEIELDFDFSTLGAEVRRQVSILVDDKKTGKRLRRRVEVPFGYNAASEKIAEAIDQLLLASGAEAFVPDEDMDARLLARFLSGFSMHEENYFAWRPLQVVRGEGGEDGSGLERVKFQVSVKYEVFNSKAWSGTRCQMYPKRSAWDGCRENGEGRSVSAFFAFTQKSFWDLFSPSDRSAPFVESNYRPEFIVALRRHERDRDKAYLVGFMHESNGLGVTRRDEKDFSAEQSAIFRDRSRSWNNVYVGGHGYSLLKSAKWSLNYGGKVWLRVGEASHDLARHLGISDRLGAEGFLSLKRAVFYEYKVQSDKALGISNLSRTELTARLRARSGVVSLSVPIPWSKGWSRLSLYGQLFYGKGESLLTADKTTLAGYVGFGLL